MENLNLNNDNLVTGILVFFVLFAGIAWFFVRKSIAGLRANIRSLEMELKKPKKKKKKAESDDEDISGKRHIDNVKEGDVLADDLYQSADGKRLLKKGTTLKASQIEKLKQWGVKFVKIEM